MSDNVPIKIARLSQVFGAGVLPGENRVFAQFARSAMKGEDIVVPEGMASEEVKDSANFDDFDTEDITFAYCTECIVGKSDAFRGEGKADAFRQTISPWGDSMVFIDDEECEC